MRTKDKVSAIINEVEEKNAEVRKVGEGYTMSGQDIANAYNKEGVKKKVLLDEQAITGNDTAFMSALRAFIVKPHTTLQREFPAAGGARKIVMAMKKVYWKARAKMFFPMFQEQNEINSLNLACLSELNRMRSEYELEMTRLRGSMERLIKQNSLLVERVDKLQGVVNSLGLTKGCGLSDVEYEDFENNFRGSEEDIAERLKIYLPYFKDVGNPVMEIGSGRGEFLTMMRDENVKAFGVDVFEPFVNKCKKKGLEVKFGDGVSYMQDVEDNSLGGIFAAQVIEHISTEDLIVLCKESFRCVQNGGYVIFETPNPTCSSIFTNSFYIDPSHKNPVHPSLVYYIMKMVGFAEVEILYTEGSKCPERIPELKGEGIENLDEFNKGIAQLNNKYFGSQDYAVIARKFV